MFSASVISQFDKIKSPRILVLGDVILDRYTFGNAERVSPEAPVLVLRCDAQEIRLGGAASVAFLLRALGAQVTLAGVVGDDAAGRMLQKLIQNAGIDSHLVRTDPHRPTTTKERFVGRTDDRSSGGGHQILRVDSESREPIGHELEGELIADILSRLDEHDALLISDYAKGVCTYHLLAILLNNARMSGIPTIVDPARIADYGRYHRATLVKPNRAEAELAANRRIRTPQDALYAARHLCRRHEFEATLVTLDQEGMALVHDDDSEELFPTEPREVCDVTGAGDMVLATLGLCVASDLTLANSIRIANVAACLEVERLGVAPITRAELRTALERAKGGARHSASVVDGQASVVATDHCPLTTDKSEIRNPQSEIASKLTTLPAMTEFASEYRLAKKTTVFTNGCFDLLHIGHVRCLQEAAALGDVLIVAVNSDASVRRLKGEGRPVISERERAALVASLECVDYVVIFDDDTPHRLLEQIRPNVLVKGGTTGEIVGREVVESYGGLAIRVSELPGISTTEIITRLHESQPPPEKQRAGGQSADLAPLPAIH
ncbi:MAG: PfkB family carbohydrate kinase [Deltaproteobacteria bacterium]